MERPPTPESNMPIGFELILYKNKKAALIEAAFYKLFKRHLAIRNRAQLLHLALNQYLQQKELLGLLKNQVHNQTLLLFQL